MKASEDWKSKVASLKTYAEGSLKQLEEDKEYLLRQLKDLENSLEIVHGLVSQPIIRITKYSALGPATTDPSVDRSAKSRIIKGTPIDLAKQLNEQKEKIPTYRSIINRFEQIGTLLQTCLRRLSEAETFIP